MNKKIKGKVKKEQRETIVIPAGIEAKIEDNELVFKKENNEVRRKLDVMIKASLEGNNLTLSTNKSRRMEKRKLGTLRSHISNIFEGFNQGYEYELEICHIHFPITVTYDKTKKEFAVKNLLGERSPRIVKAYMPEKVEVEIKAPIIKIKSFDLEVAGQNAANLEKIAKIRNRDRNKFQDGIFITKKPGKHFL